MGISPWPVKKNDRVSEVAPGEPCLKFKAVEAVHTDIENQAGWNGRDGCVAEIGLFLFEEFLGRRIGVRREACGSHESRQSVSDRGVVVDDVGLFGEGRACGRSRLGECNRVWVGGR